MKKKVLNLTVSKGWFDKIASGEKTEEYRKIGDYWEVRLYYHNFLRSSRKDPAEKTAKWYFEESGWKTLKPFTHVLFINGYDKHRPRIEKEIVSITIGKPKKGLCPDKWLDKEFFVIKFK